jgi:hypothetical protein
MPVFLFHVYGNSISMDEEGREFPDISAARDEAVKDVRELIAHQVLRDGTIRLHHRIDIADENGRVIETVAFSDVLRVEP